MPCAPELALALPPMLTKASPAAMPTPTPPDTDTTNIGALSQSLTETLIPDAVTATLPIEASASPEMFATAIAAPVENAPLVTPMARTWMLRIALVETNSPPPAPPMIAPSSM